jgi:hypothetical protein
MEQYLLVGLGKQTGMCAATAGMARKLIMSCIVSGMKGQRFYFGEKYFDGWIKWVSK